MHPEFRNGERTNPKQDSYEVKVREAFEACIAIENESAEAAEMDHGFDAGEFSGPAHLRALLRELNAKAKSFGFPDFDHLQDEAQRLGLISVEGRL